MRRQDIALIGCDGSRRNNFTIIGIILGWPVLHGHSDAIPKAPGLKDLLNILFQDSIWIGALAVNGFFAIIGFIRSLKSRRTKDLLKIFKLIFTIPYVYTPLNHEVYRVFVIITAFLSWRHIEKPVVGMKKILNMGIK